jgi:hypothetical protein
MHEWPPVEHLQFIVGYELEAVGVFGVPVHLHFVKDNRKAQIILEEYTPIRMPDGWVHEHDHPNQTGVMLIDFIGQKVTGVERVSDWEVRLHLGGATLTMDSSSPYGETYHFISEDGAVHV